ncbi:hypothetical protein CL628_04600 [bacterium]|nr:hypothetical protein [bacterium]
MDSVTRVLKKLIQTAVLAAGILGIWLLTALVIFGVMNEANAGEIGLASARQFGEIAGIIVIGLLLALAHYILARMILKIWQPDNHPMRVVR